MLARNKLEFAFLTDYVRNTKRFPVHGFVRTK